MVLFLDRAPVIGNARIGRGRRRAALWQRRGGGQLQVGIALVVPKQDVVLRVQRLDQVVFQQQRLGLRTHHRGFHAHDLGDHVANARAALVFLEIAGDALFQVARLADVQHAAVGVEIAVNARQRRQRSDFAEQLGIKFVQG